ncbi:hypothetical protein [Legionella bozemanae]|uniref:Uncharacterized protein n=1 Tax=Legionella bozemanae TaxID=447 RepID=A0A0W0S2S9_LEGBO|nr:hypothetical protein [Legionella bozemanae]KTC77237.1 hypothetical protein Lboz_0190 [Legionella bozemanae]STO32851.1 Uncharacterised protein [Legionella bozemanae]
MFYRLLLNYFRLKLVQFIFTQLMMRLKLKKPEKTKSLIGFLELFLSHYMTKKMRK